MYLGYQISRNIGYDVTVFIRGQLFHHKPYDECHDKGIHRTYNYKAEYTNPFFHSLSLRSTIKFNSSN